MKWKEQRIFSTFQLAQRILRKQARKQSKTNILFIIWFGIIWRYIEKIIKEAKVKVWKRGAIDLVEHISFRKREVRGGKYG